MFCEVWVMDGSEKSNFLDPYRIESESLLVEGTTMRHAAIVEFHRSKVTPTIFEFFCKSVALSI